MALKVNWLKPSFICIIFNLILFFSYVSWPKDTILDWWMIGQARLAVITAASTFGQTAVDRSGSERFIVGGLTQCTNPNKDYYLEKIYSSPLENWAKEGRIVYNPFI